MTRVAAIDCGTNSVRLLVADLPDGTGCRPTWSAGWRSSGWAQGVDRTGRLAPEAIEATRVALADYAAQIRDLGAARTRMVATSATRDAANADEFRAMVERTLGVDPGGGHRATRRPASRSPARSAGCRPTCPAPYLVVDIGGGSTEFVLGTAEPDARDQRRHRLRPDDRAAPARRPADPGRSPRPSADIDGGGRPGAGRRCPAGDARTLVGLAGSVTTVTALALGLDRYRPEAIHHARVSYDQVAAVTADLLGMTRAQRLALPVMHPGRADVIGAGALILRVLMERAGARLGGRQRARHPRRHRLVAFVPRGWTGSSGGG